MNGKSLDFLKSAFDSLTENIAVLDDTGNIVTVNRSWRDFAESNQPLTANVNEGANYLDVCLKAVENGDKTAEAFVEGIRSVITGKADAYSQEYPCHSPDEKRWFVGHVSAFQYNGNHYAVVRHENITRKKQAENSLAESEARYRALVESSFDFLFLLDPDGTYLAANDRMEKCAVLNGKTVTGSHVSDLHSPDVADSYMKQIDCVLNTGESVEFEHGMMHGNDEHIHRSILYPVFRDGTIWAVGGICRDVTMHKHSEKLAKENEQRFKVIFDNSNDGILVGDATTKKLVMANSKICEMLGYTKEELLQLSVSDIHPAEELPRVFAEFEKQLKREIRFSENLPVKRKDGVVFYADISSSPIDMNGKTFLIGTFRDITERLQSQTELKANKALLDATGMMANVGGWELDVETLQLNWTEQTYRIHEVPADYVPQVDEAIDFYHPDDRERLVNAVRRAVDHGEPYDMEVRFTSAKGKNLWVRTNCFPQIVNGKLVKLQGSFQDITDRKRTEEALKAGEELFRDMVEKLPIPLAVGTADYKTEYVNAKFREVFGYKIEDIPDQKAWREKFFPDPAYRAEISREVDNWVANKDLLATFTRRYTDKWGREHDMVVKVMNLKDRFYNILEDITERKQAEEALARKEAELRATLYSIGDAMISTDTEGKVVRMNRVAEDLTGWKESEVIGKPLNEIYQIVREETAGRSKIDSDGAQHEEDTVGMKKQPRLVSKHGTVIPIAENSSTILNDRDEITGTVTVFRDQTDELLNRRLFETRLSLIEYAGKHSLSELLTRALDEAGAFVDSPIGFYHFVESDQKVLSLQQWSTRTLNEFCRTEGSGLHYDIDQAGVWGDCVKEKKPVIHNDYASLPHKKGMPKGHAEVIRELVVPVTRGKKVVAILGVGNKPSDYTQKDADIVSYFADVTWEIIRQKRADEEISHQKYIERELSQLSTFLLTTTQIEEISYYVLEVAKNLTKSRFGFAGTVDPETGSLICHTMTRDVWKECNIPDKSIVFEKRAGLWGWVLDHHEAIMVNDTKIDLRSTGTPHGHIPIEAFLGVPVMIGDQVVGQIALANPENRFLDEDLEIAKKLATLYAMAIQRHNYEKALLEAETKRAEDLEELVKDRTAELSESKELLEKIFNSQQDAIFVLDSAIPPLIIDCNPAAERMFGYAREEMIGRSTEFLHVDSESLKDFQRDLYPQIEKLGIFRLRDFEMKHRDGTLFPTENSVAQLLDEQNKRIGWISVVHDISEQKSYEEALRQNEEKFRTVADFTYDWEDWVATDGSYLYVSPSCERITGYPREAFIENRSHLLDIIHPEDCAVFARHLESAKREASVDNVDFRIITRNGDVRWISHSCQPVFNKQGKWLGRRGSNRDITERMHTERQLKNSRDTLRAVFDGISEPLMLIHNDGSIRMMNIAATEYYDTSLDIALSGKPCFEVMKGKTEPCSECRVFQTIQSGRYTSFERKGFKKNGRIEQVSIYPLKKSEDEEGAAIIRIRDVTVEKQMEQELIQADKMISLGILVSGVAHEINNPNNFIMLNAPLLKEVWDSVNPILERHYENHGDFSTAGLPYSEMRDEVPNLLNGIETGAKRIQRIVKDLKEYSRRDLGRTDESVNINDIVQQAIALLRSQIKKSTHNFSVKYGQNLPTIKGNSQKLEQVMINLIQNACQALPDTEKGIDVATAFVAATGEIVFTVKDEGIGIPDDAMPHIMDPFFTTKRDTGGTGLGLSVSSNIVNEHGGRIEVRSSQGHGSTFVIRFPVKPKKASVQVLVVDDDSDVRDVCTAVLTRNDRYSVKQASNGTEASIKLGIEKPDLVLLDMQMPDMNGVEICRMIKTDSALSGIKVIIITGEMSSPKIAEAMALGFETVLPKPFTATELMTTVDRVLAHLG